MLSKAFPVSIVFIANRACLPSQWPLYHANVRGDVVGVWFVEAVSQERTTKKMAAAPYEI